MLTPFDPQPLTAEQQQQVNDRKWGDVFIGKISVEIGKVVTQEAQVYQKWAEEVKFGQFHPAIDVDVNQLQATAGEYHRLFQLQSDLYNYLNGVIGWVGGIGQPNHPTSTELVEQLAQNYPDAAAVVK